jgi:hypothetical protein
VFQSKKQEAVFDSGPEAFNLLMKEAVLREFLDDQQDDAIYLGCQAKFYRQNGHHPLPSRNRIKHD